MQPRPRARGIRAPGGVVHGGGIYTPEIDRLAASGVRLRVRRSAAGADAVGTAPRCGLRDRHRGHLGLDWHRDDVLLDEPGYATDLIAAEAVRRIEERDPGRPLFLYVAFNAPHIPLEAPPEELERNAHVTDPRRRTYAAMVTSMDQAIGRIRNALEREGISATTIVLFLSDNGGAAGLGSNRPFRGAKHDLYEGGVRVPAAVSWPGRLEAGRVVEEPPPLEDHGVEPPLGYPLWRQWQRIRRDWSAQTP